MKILGETMNFKDFKKKGLTFLLRNDNSYIIIIHQQTSPSPPILKLDDSTHQVLASSVVHRQISLPPASLLHPLVFSSNKESLLMCSHLSCGLLIDLP